MCVSNVPQQDLGDEGSLAESMREIHRSEILTHSNFVT